ncbi:kinesin [Reticulomyxa filosa]|uniref:Kinesin n=1 Tax=Reticulomyxa filosa TaxID=46433 RepID=X6MYU9_RETFI|nr:kinesin [Reticulomyxa filosa]|eukprot:ETO18240.1 kinesin [Reticulomyxa filosa]
MQVKLANFLRIWDQVKNKKKQNKKKQSNSAQRDDILRHFVHHYEKKTQQSSSLSLDAELGDVAPLPNITKYFPPLVQSISIYVECKENNEYIKQFVSSGGMQTLVAVTKYDISREDQIEIMKILKSLIRYKSECKQIICETETIDSLLHNCKSEDADVLYALYDILKQLCIVKQQMKYKIYLFFRNDEYQHKIHCKIVNKLLNKSTNVELKKTLVKVLQSTLVQANNHLIAFCQGKGENKLNNKQKKLSRDYINKKLPNEQIEAIIELMATSNHQLQYERYVYDNIALILCFYFRVTRTQIKNKFLKCLSTDSVNVLVITMIKSHKYHSQMVTCLCDVMDQSSKNSIIHKTIKSNQRLFKTEEDEYMLFSTENIARLKKALLDLNETTTSLSSKLGYAIRTHHLFILSFLNITLNVFKSFSILFEMQYQNIPNNNGKISVASSAAAQLLGINLLTTKPEKANGISDLNSSSTTSTVVPLDHLHIVNKSSIDTSGNDHIENYVPKHQQSAPITPEEGRYSHNIQNFNFSSQNGLDNVLNYNRGPSDTSAYDTNYTSNRSDKTEFNLATNQYFSETPNLVPNGQVKKTEPSDFGSHSLPQNINFSEPAPPRPPPYFDIKEIPHIAFHTSIDGLSEEKTIDNNVSNIRVVVRIRPKLNEELNSQEILMLDANDTNSLHVTHPKKSKQFTYDYVATPQTTQELLFQNCGVTQLIDASINGFATTIFAYGPTGSGKTYSISGDETTLMQQLESGHTDHNQFGLIPRSIQFFWQKLENYREQQKNVFTIKAGYLEIYNEKVSDISSLQKILSTTLKKKPFSPQKKAKRFVRSEFLKFGGPMEFRRWIFC